MANQNSQAGVGNFNNHNYMENGGQHLNLNNNNCKRQFCFRFLEFFFVCALSIFYVIVLADRGMMVVFGVSLPKTRKVY